MVATTASCIEPDPKVLRLDKEYGFRGFQLGPGLYDEIRRQVESRASSFDVLEFETFGSRFADQQLFEQRDELAVFGARVTNVFAGVVDRTVYAFLLQVESDEDHQDALQDSLLIYYGTPQAVTDTTYYTGTTKVRVQTRSWEADRVAMEFGRGDGFAELLIYDKTLREKRVDIQRLITVAQASTTPTVNTLTQVGRVRLNTTASTARWRYRFRGHRSESQEGIYGAVDYRYVYPFFGVRGQSLYGVDMAFVNMQFGERTDSLTALEVEFDNTQGRVVGFMDMLRIMERRLGRHTYSDTLHTLKGPFRRAYWYGNRLTVQLEEYRFRPESSDRADVRVNFLLDRVKSEAPAYIPEEEGIEIKSEEVGITSAPSDSVSRRLPEREANE